MHANGDHHGSLPSVKSISPATALACHRGDRELIENPENLYKNRYNLLARERGLGASRDGMLYSTNCCKIDVLISGGQILDLTKDWKLKVWHVPGHSDGHLSGLRRKN